MTTQCRDWQAWLDKMPPGPHTLHVSGDVLVANPGIEVVLTMREPQGFNPAILMLDLHLMQKPGNWPQIITCAPAKYTRVISPNAIKYTAIDIHENGERLVLIDHIAETS